MPTFTPPSQPLALNRTKAAKFIGVSPDTLDRAEREGLIRSIKLGEARNSTRLFPVAECYRFLGLHPRTGEPLDGEDR